MKHYRRLLALVALSLFLHLLALTWARHQVLPTMGVAVEAPPPPLALRLQQTPPLPAPEPVPEPPPPAPAADLPPPPAKIAAPDAGNPAPAAEVPAAPADTVAAAPAAALPAGPTGQAAIMRMPGRYRSDLPPSTAITYTVTRPGRAPTAAQLRWDTDGATYTVHSDGILGKLSAQGSGSDAGVSPKTAEEQRTGGKTVTTLFSVDTIAIDGRDYPNNVGSQDRASLLLQLTGMGLTAPIQLRNVIEIFVAGPREPDVMTFQAGEDEELATPLGAIATCHLVQVTRPGAARLEIWLAPALGWVPVQLRLTAPNGAASTQTVTRIDSAGR
jgi:hypothetical protein